MIFDGAETSYMQALGAMPAVLEWCLNHVSSLDRSDRQLNRQPMRHYYQYRYEREIRNAWQQLGTFLEKTCRGQMPELPNPTYETYDLGPEDAPALPEPA